MKVQNVFDSFAAPAAAFFGTAVPVEGSPDYEEEMKNFTAARDEFVKVCGVENLTDLVSLKFSLGSIVFDLVSAAAQMKLYTPPESPKLLRRVQKQWDDYALQADQPEIEIPDEWIPLIDKIFLDDQKFSQIGIHGEIPNPANPSKTTIALAARVLNSMPTIRTALLGILPE